MCVWVDSAGNHKFPGSIDGFIESTGNLLEVLPYHHNCRAIDENISRVGIGGSHDMSVTDEDFHRGQYIKKFGVVTGRIPIVNSGFVGKKRGSSSETPRISDLVLNVPTCKTHLDTGVRRK